MKVNFYWSGQGWSFINRLTIASHIRVGHDVFLWVDVRPKENLYWVDDLPIKIKSAKKYIRTEKLLKKGWNVRTISTVFQYNIMMNTGEYTADVDAIALKHWPDIPLLLCPESKSLISSVGVLRVPKDHKVLKCAKSKAKSHWGNVRVFSNCCRQHGLKSTHEKSEFYPISAGAGRAAKNILTEKNIPNAFSYHVFTNNQFGRKIAHKILENDKYKDSLLKKLSDWSFGDDYSITRKGK